MILTTTNSIEGKEIKEYLGAITAIGFISPDDLTVSYPYPDKPPKESEIKTHEDIVKADDYDRAFLSVHTNAYQKAFESACFKLESLAQIKKADAIVGMSTDVSSFGNTGLIIVTVTGTAVLTCDLSEM